MNKRGTAAVAALVLGLAAGGVLTQQKPEVLVKQRQAAMTLQGKYFGPLAAMAQGKAPYNAEVVKRNAGFLDNLSRMPWDGFDPSTKDVKSHAKPEVFTDSAGVKEAISRLDRKSTRLNSSHMSISYAVFCLK